MSQFVVHQQLHGYRKGHQLLSSSVRLSDGDQDTVDRLSDISGPLGPSEQFEPYLTTYPLPSGSHYVIARSFQDLDATRDGCVLTRSVLLSTADWVHLEGLAGILAILDDTPSRLAVSQIHVRSGGPVPKTVHDSRLPELVALLFLDKRRPVVFFAALDAETIAVRLLVALWPALRRKFSICTYALAPRWIGPSYFDLMFAPISAGLRFTETPVHAVGAKVSVPPDSIHRWAKSTAAIIFQSDVPFLAAHDPLGVLSRDVVGDEAELRVALLWNDLVSRSRESPTAVLGMLDILNARGTAYRDIWKEIEPAVVGALDVAETRLSTEKAWKYLFALEAKFGEHQAPEALLARIEGAAHRLARQDPRCALARLAEHTRRDLGLPTRILTGLADGIAESESFHDLPAWLEPIPAPTVLQLVLSSQEMIAGVAHALVAHKGSWSKVMSRVFEVPERTTRDRLRRALFLAMGRRATPSVVSALLRGVSGKELIGIVGDSGTQTGFADSELDAVFVQAANDAGVMQLLRDVLVRQFTSSEADRILLATLSFEVGDIMWLQAHRENRLRASRLLGALVDGASDAEIAQVCSERHIALRVLRLLDVHSDTHVDALGRVLTLADLDVHETIDVGLRVLPQVRNDREISLNARILRQSLAEAHPDDERVRRVLEECGPRVSSEDLVGFATASAATSPRVARNLMALNSASSTLRDRVVHEVDELSEQLVRRARENLGSEAYSAWAEMIGDAKRDSHDVGVAAASTALRFGLQSADLPVSALVVRAFPIVYRELQDLNSVEIDDWVSDWNALAPFSGRGGKRRRRIRAQLAKLLVDSFVRSIWPPADLLVAAIGAGVQKKVLGRVRRRYPSRQYLVDIEEDCHHRDDAVKKEILRCLADYGRTIRTKD